MSFKLLQAHNERRIFGEEGEIGIVILWVIGDLVEGFEESGEVFGAFSLERHGGRGVDSAVMERMMVLCTGKKLCYLVEMGWGD